MKILLVASVLSHIAAFHRPLINMLKEHGHTVYVAALDNLSKTNIQIIDNIDRLFNIAFHRSPFSISNISAYTQLKSVINSGKYDIIHCHTPTASVLTRLAARETRKKNKTRVIYTAHGFHFYKGAPLKNWLLYYPVERLLCRYTDILVTITEEDDKLVKKHFPVQSFHMHGVGADSHRFVPVNDDEKQLIKKQLGLQQEQRVILCVGELIPRKNQAALIRAAATIVKSIPEVIILLAGKGPEEHNLRALIRELRLEKHVILLGYCSNVQQYMQAANLIVSCSLQEGLPVNIMEAMLVAKPIVASDNRGHRELIQEGVCGYIVPPSDANKYANHIIQLLNDKELYQKFSKEAQKRGALYAIEHILPELETLYNMANLHD